MTESRQNQIFKEIKALKTKHGRDKLNLFFAEGERLVKSVPQSIIKYFVFSEKAGDDLKSRLSTSDFPTYTFSDKLFAEISDTVTPQGVLCVCEKKAYPLEAALVKKPEFLVICENIQDPGNLGTIIRTADAAGAGGVILSKGCVDLCSPKVLRSAMGSAFNLPIVTNADLSEVMPILKQKGVMTLASHLKGTQTPYSIDLKQPFALIVGNEANGLTEAVAAAADKLVKLPMYGGAESLNASVAGGILIYEAVRQRINLRTIQG